MHPCLRIKRYQCTRTAVTKLRSGCPRDGALQEHHSLLFPQEDVDCVPRALSRRVYSSPCMMEGVSRIVESLGPVAFGYHPFGWAATFWYVIIMSLKKHFRQISVVLCKLPKHVWSTSKSCSSHFKNTCLKQIWNMSQTYLKQIWSMPEICVQHCRTIFKLCLQHVYAMSKSCLNYV